MATHRLIAEDGTLYFPHGGDDVEPSLLLARYDAGDCDTCAWPMVEKSWSSVKDQRQTLARALFDERETNDTFGDRDTIELPDGTVFDFDMVLVEWEAERRAERER